MIILTSNGRRELRQKFYVVTSVLKFLPGTSRLDPYYSWNPLKTKMTNVPLPIGLLELLIRIGGQIRKENPENAPSPKEMALCGIDLMVSGSNNVTDRSVA